MSEEAQPMSEEAQPTPKPGPKGTQMLHFKLHVPYAQVRCSACSTVVSCSGIAAIARRKSQESVTAMPTLRCLPALQNAQTVAPPVSFTVATM
eukprot:383412-Amphidinium_carterae.3